MIVTLVAVSFFTTTAAYLLSIVEKIGPVSVRPFDAAGAGAYFGAILAAYVGHSWVNSRATNGTAVPTTATDPNAAPPAPPITPTNG